MPFKWTLGDYTRALYDLMPVVVLGMITGTIFNWRKLFRTSSTAWDRVWLLVAEAAISGLATLLAMLLLPSILKLFPSLEMSKETAMAIGMIAGCRGHWLFDAIARFAEKRTGIDLHDHDPDHIDDTQKDDRAGR